MTEPMRGDVPFHPDLLPPVTRVFSTRSGEETRAVAACLGSLLVGGEVLGLVGDLGAGKTCFVQGLARGLGVPPGAYVNSPTFTLVNHHAGRVPLVHVDLYRLGDPEEVTFIGYDDLFDGEAVVAIEWFERFPELWPREFLCVWLVEGEAASAEVPSASGETVATALHSPATDTEEGDPFGHMPRVLQVGAHGPRHQTLLEHWRTSVMGSLAPVRSGRP